MSTEQKRTLRNYALALALCVVAVVAANVLFDKPDAAMQLLARKSHDKQEVIGLLQSKAQMATTEVTLRRMGIYDSETNFATISPAGWKLGRRACIMPVDITIKYGIDMGKLRESDIRLDSATVRIRLPQPEVIDYDVAQRTDRREVVTMSGWLRDEVGEQTMQAVKNKVAAQVLADSTLFNSLASEVQSNTQSLFRSMLLQMGLKAVFIK